MTQRVQNARERGGVNGRVVDLSRLLDHPRELLADQAELGVDAYRVSARVLAMPSPVEVDRNESVNGEPRRRVAKSLVAQAGGDAFGTQKGSEQRCALP